MLRASRVPKSVHFALYVVTISRMRWAAAEDISRLLKILSQARGGGDMSSGGFAARAQAAGDRNANADAGGGQGGKK